MATWQYLPDHVLVKIYGYLTRRDRLSCFMVCQNWKSLLYSASLWKSMVVYLDTDLSEPSTLLTVREFHGYLQSMEFCWANAHLSARWMQQRHHEVSKRASRFILLLIDYCVQLSAVTIVDWFDIFRFKKVVFCLAKFMRSQVNLCTVCFINTNFNKLHALKLLRSCLSSEASIKRLDISTCYYPHMTSLENVAMIVSCIERLLHLVELRVDYSALSGGVLEAIISSRNCVLKYLDVSIRDIDYFDQVISKEAWKELHEQCPDMKVALHFKKICHFSNISHLLHKTIPLTTFSMHSGHLWDQTRSREYKKTLLLLIANYQSTLENLYLQLQHNTEILDEVIVTLLRECTKLQNFNFNGVIKDMDLLKQICSMQMGNNRNSFQHFYVLPGDLTLKNHLIISQIYRDFGGQFQENKIDFQVGNNCGKNMVYVYY